MKNINRKSDMASCVSRDAKLQEKPFAKRFSHLFRCAALSATLVLGVAVDSMAQGTLKGQVLDSNGSPLPGASVTVKGTTISTLADVDGNFVLRNVPTGSQTIVANQTGNESLSEIVMPDGATVTLNLTVNSPLLESGINARKSMMGISEVVMDDITSKNYSTYSLDNLQALIGGYNGASVWGQSGALILVDGYPRNANTVRPEEIEKIEVLKGAQAVAYYGSLGANGIISITTKRGKAEPLKISARANTGFDIVKQYPEYLGAAEYMYMYNLASSNDGVSKLPYSDEDIYYTQQGTNPYKYPDINFYDKEYVRNWRNVTDATAVMQGGNDFATFYTDIYYAHSNGYVKVGEAGNSNSNTLAVRGNVDMKFNDNITAQVDAFVNMQSSKGAQGKNYFTEASTFRPNRFNPLISVDMIDPSATHALELISVEPNLVDGKYFYSGTVVTDDQKNVFSDMYSAGNYTSNNREFQFNTKLNFNLGSLVDGLSFHTQYGMSYQTDYTTSYSNDYAVYVPVWEDFGDGPVIVDLDKKNENKKSGVQNIGGTRAYRVFAFNAHFDYNRSFGQNNLKAVLLANGHQIVEPGEYHRTSNAELSLNASYDFDNKYFVDATVAMPHSAKLEEGNRNGFSPSLTLGWNISKSSFFNSNFINHLALSVSASKLCQDIDISNYYLYREAWERGYGYSWGEVSGSQQFVYPTRSANKDLDFVHRKEVSANLTMGMLNNSLLLDASVFASVTDNLLVSSSMYMPSYFQSRGSYLTQVNYNENSYKGVDFALSYKKKFGEVDMKLGVNGTYYIAIAKKRDDSQAQEEYQKRTGLYLDGAWGYKCLGYFTDDDDVAQHPDQTPLGGGTPKAGDLKYQDINGDGQIDTRDQVELGRYGWYGSPFTLGINYTAKYKNFTLFVVGTGYFGGLGLKNSEYYWVNGNDKYSATVRDTWTEDNPNAKYPRLTTGNGQNNFQTSDFWTYKNNRFSLQKVQLTYDFPASMFQDNFLSGVSVYVSGSNLLTLSKERELLEMSLGNNIQTRFYNMGVKVTF